jgi:hypothetical protein
VSSEVLTYTCGPGQTAVGSQGRIWNLLNAPGGPVTISADTRAVGGGQSPQRIFKSVPPGTKFTAAAGEKWTYLRIDSIVLQTITIFIGDEDLQFNNAVTITGLAAVAMQPSSAISETAPINPTAAGQHALFAANAARRRITVYSDPANAGDATIFLRKAGGVNDIGFITPGTFQELDTLAGVDYRAPIGGDKLYIFEEA